ncbi:hypothetical protein ACFOUP_07735 [Belliella kenyensis]|uniref:Diguanylate cyclase n=1 Tax=Belliella kenyensis TaxID=1472724 RepID=A0ABV8EL34_9BACT|nr:hypothetical protein [Belliella kenyensis]MCH7400365.1 hypothetical protein [Belliella kenyensis]MDN3604617.1 hypothetical protein [Belliella kenyensis]
MALSDLTISKNLQSLDDMDFDFLRKKGIEYIEQFGGKLWTDYNTHDPGITTLEILCYAITDLGLRINMPISDLLHSDDDFRQFYEAHQILTNQALTSLDYRKLFLDVAPLQINNCFLAPFSKTLYVNCKDGKVSLSNKILEGIPEDLTHQTPVKGLYTLWLDLDDNIENERQLIESIRNVYHANRNLCEDLVDIKKIEKQEVKICADIELHPTADENLIQAKILLTIEDYFSPKIKWYSLGEMIQLGHPITTIFDGPLLNHGFILDDDLTKSQLRNAVRLSDLINLILQIDGVQLIHDISISFCQDSKGNEDAWNLCLKPNHKPAICKNQSTFSFKKEGLPINMSPKKIEDYKNLLYKNIAQSLQNKTLNNTLQLPEGARYQLSGYQSISLNFPDNYGIGIHGISTNEPPLRHAQVKQLKAYLLFFDQVLASYFMQLERVKEQLAIQNNLEDSYFTQVVSSMKGIEDLIANFEDFDPSTLFDKFDNKAKRISTIKNHLIARFAENFGNYAFLMKNIYGDSSEEIVNANKQSFLENYDHISSRRAGAFFYYKQSADNLWNSTNVSGLENRIAGLLGIKMSADNSYKRETITEKYVELYKVNATQYRWRIRDDDNQIILTATENYDSFHDAEKEMYQNIYKAINSDKAAISNIENGNFKRKTVDVVELVKSENGKYSFNIINPRIKSVNDPKRIIARQYRFFNSLEKVRNAVLETLKFLAFTFSDEGIHVLEHILLLPEGKNQVKEDHYLTICADDCTKSCSSDPYSFRLSIVLPGYTQRFSDINFRKFAENLIRREIPAHILAKICWVGHRKNTVEPEQNDLLQFETYFKNFLEEKASGKQNSLPQLINAIQNLNNYYLPGQLHDCDNNDMAGKIILGKSNI